MNAMRRACLLRRNIHFSPLTVGQAIPLRFDAAAGTWMRASREMSNGTALAWPHHASRRSFSDDASKKLRRGAAAASAPGNDADGEGAPSAKGNRASSVHASAQPEARARPGQLAWWREQRDKLRVMWKRYGVVAIGTYWVLYLAQLGTVYVLLDSGVVDLDIDVGDYLHKIYNMLGDDPPAFVGRYFASIHHAAETYPWGKNLVVADVLTELTEPVRYIVVFAATPSIARAVGRAPPLEDKREDKNKDAGRR